MADADPHLRLSLQYQPHALDRAAAQTLAGRLERVLHSLVTEPWGPVGTVDVLTPAERERVRGGAAATGAPDATVPGRFEERAAAVPEAAAVVSGGRRLTYRELDERANRVAHRLREHGAGPETLVAVALPRTCDLVVGLLGVLKAGAGYVPVDPEYPSRRLEFVLGDAAPALILTDPVSAAALPDTGLPVLHLAAAEGDDPTPLADGPHPDNVAYVMYTSGSTGVPKGVTLTHRNVTGCLPSLAEAVGVRAGTRMLAGASVNFDVSVFEIFTTLTHGGTVELVRDVLELGERDDWDADVISSVPSAFAELLDGLPGRISPRAVVFAGEGLPAALVARARQAFPGLRVVNGYGQTESFYATAFTLGPDDEFGGEGAAPIGEPLEHVRAHVLGAGLGPVPQGVTGELYVAQPGRASSGWWNCSTRSAPPLTTRCSR
ncbi:non-ribosomal peptide synthetase [Streptomyces violaceorubidus]